MQPLLSDFLPIACRILLLWTVVSATFFHSAVYEIHAKHFLSYGNKVSYIRKNVPWHILAPRRGCLGNHLPLRRVRIRAERFLSYGNEVSYTIKKENIISDVLFSMLSSVSFFLPNPSFLLHWQAPTLSAAPLRKALQALSGCLPRTAL